MPRGPDKSKWKTFQCPKCDERTTQPPMAKEIYHNCKVAKKVVTFKELT